MAQAKTRALRQLIRGVLAKHAVPDELAAAMEFELSAVVAQHFKSKEKKLTEEREKNLDVLEFIGSSAGIAGPLKEVQDEFEDAFQRSPNWVSRDWDSLAKFFIKQKKEGKTVAKFAEWFKSDEFRRKQGIFLTPDRIRDWWTQAFSTQQSSKFEGV